jgi:protein N-terminal methyltransferase
MMQNDWYTKAIDYWDGVEASPTGMLGGYEYKLINKRYITHIDAASTKEFLKGSAVSGVGCDCGAGIGRVTEEALQELCSTVDLVEQSSKFLEVANTKLGSNPKVGRFINVGLQHFEPEMGRYDLIWTQW